MSSSSDCKSSDCCTSSVDIINEPFIYRHDKCEESPSCSYIYESETCQPKCGIACDFRSGRRNFNHPDVCTFKSIITPLSELTPYNSKTPGPIQFRMRRKNKVVSLQWEPFSGKITTTGVAYMSMVQTICNMPPYSVFGVYNLEYNGVLRQAPIEINPNNVKAQVLFYFNADGSTTGVTANDSVSVKGGYLSWIVC